MHVAAQGCQDRFVETTDGGGLLPERQARVEIDRQLVAAGWTVQDYRAMDVRAARGVAVRELPTAAGPADYVLFLDRQAIGVIEAKKDGTSIKDHLFGPVGLPGRVPERITATAYCHRAARHGDRQRNQMQTLGIHMLVRSKAEG